MLPGGKTLPQTELRSLDQDGIHLDGKIAHFHSDAVGRKQVSTLPFQELSPKVPISLIGQRGKRRKQLQTQYL